MPLFDDIYEEINEAWSSDDRDNEEFRILVAALVLLYSAEELTYARAKAIVSPLVGQSFYREKIDRAYETRDFSDLTQLRWYCFFFKLVTNSSYLFHTQFLKRPSPRSSEHRRALIVSVPSAHVYFLVTDPPYFSGTRLL
jgi:hypothetical protein